MSDINRYEASELAPETIVCLEVDHLAKITELKDKLSIKQLENIKGSSVLDDKNIELGERSKLITELEKEVAILRLYGNRDCTAAADEEIQRLKLKRKRK